MYYITLSLVEGLQFFLLQYQSFIFSTGMRTPTSYLFHNIIYCSHLSDPKYHLEYNPFIDYFHINEAFSS